MKRQLITLAIASGLTLGSLASIHAQDENPGDNGGGRGPHGRGGHHEHGGPGGPGGGGNPIEHLTKKLDLTADQQAKIQPIVDQAKPQLEAIHKDAMQKSRLVLESSMQQIRPLLTPEQQQKLDAMKAAHEKMHDARQEMRDAKQK